MKPKSADLHAHSHCSDGTLSPSDLVKKAAESGIHALSITDHDTTAGIPEAEAAGLLYGVEIVPGMEISALHPSGTLHILGYYIDIHDKFLQDNLRKYIFARERRNPLILQKLHELGYPLEIEEVKALAGGEVVNRPHIARAMLRRGYVQSIQESFDRFLANGAPAFAPKEIFTPEEAISFIHQAGGLAVIAHPDQLYADSMEQTLNEIRRLAAVGIDGVEAYHGACRSDFAECYAALAGELGLIVTGGSDFHGDSKHKNLGETEALPYIPYTFVESMKKRLAENKNSIVPTLS
ncbi:MAG: PHP domain-containing protein [Candidatus Omnitrophota bacterium]